MISETVKKDFLLFGFVEQTIHSIKVRDVIIAYRKLAMKVHPDRAGQEYTAEFQELGNAYQRCLQYLIDVMNDDTNIPKDDDSSDDDEVKFTKDNFRNFNLPKENDGSFTVFVQNDLANQWEEELENKYCEPVLECSSKGKALVRIGRLISAQITKLLN